MMLIALTPAVFGQYDDGYMAAPPMGEDFYLEDSTSTDSSWSGDSVVTGYHTYTIKKGDTLTSIAKKYYYDEEYKNLDEYMNEIMEINRLESTTIHSGCYLKIAYFK